MPHWLETVVTIFQAETSDLRKLAVLAGGDPKTFYRGASLNGVDLSGQDVRGMQFTSSIDHVVMDRVTAFDEKSFEPSEGEFWISLYNSLINVPAIVPADPLQFHDIAQALIAVRRHADAIKVYEIGLKSFPSEYQLLLPLAKLLNRRRFFGEANDVCSVILQLYPSDREACRELARAYIGRGEFPAAVELLQMLVEREPEDRVAWDMLLRANRKQGNRQGEINVLESLISNFPNSIPYYMKLGQQLQAANRLEDAAAIFNKLSERGKAGLVGLGPLSLILHELRRDDEAIAILSDHVQRRPDNLDLLRLLGRARAYAGNLEESLHILRKIISAAPRSKLGHIRWYANFMRQLGHSDVSVRLYQNAIDQDPTEVLLLKWLGELLLKEGRTAEAIDTLRRAVEIAPDDERPSKWLFAALVKAKSNNVGQSAFAVAS